MERELNSRADSREELLRASDTIRKAREAQDRAEIALRFAVALAGSSYWGTSSQETITDRAFALADTFIAKRDGAK